MLTHKQSYVLGSMKSFWANQNILAFIFAEKQKKLFGSG